jgi:hypothetical protein
MSEHSAARTVAALAEIIEVMQNLVNHPRVQQRRWVALGKTWLPILQHAKEDLEREVTQYDLVAESHQSILAALQRLGLQIEKRDATSWGYRWHGDMLKGTFSSRADAIEAALRERLPL